MTDIMTTTINNNPFNMPTTGTALITGTAFYDINENGSIEQISEYGIWNVKPSLYRCDDDGRDDETSLLLVATTSTSTQGTFQFENLAAGEYYVQFEYPSYALLGSVWSGGGGGGGGGEVDNSVNPESGATNCFTLGEGERYETHAAFTYPKTTGSNGSVGGSSPAVMDLPPSLVVTTSTTSPPTIPFMPIMEPPDNASNNNPSPEENTLNNNLVPTISPITITSDFVTTPTSYFPQEDNNNNNNIICNFCQGGMPDPSLSVTIELTCEAIANELSALDVPLESSSEECMDWKRWESRCCPVELLDSSSSSVVVPDSPPLEGEEDGDREVSTNAPTLTEEIMTKTTQPSTVTTTPIEKSFDLGLDYEQVGPIKTEGVLMNIEGVSETDSYQKWQTVTANFIKDYFARNPENVYDVSVNIQMLYETFTDIPIGTYTENKGVRGLLLRRRQLQQQQQQQRELSASLRITYNQETTFRSKDSNVYNADYVIEEPFRADYSTYIEKLKASSTKGQYDGASHVITFAVVPTLSPTISPTPAPTKSNFLEENMMYIYVGASIAGAIITAGILFLVQRRRKRRNGTVVTLESELDYAGGGGGGGGEVIAAAIPNNEVVDTVVPNATVVPNNGDFTSGSGGGGGATAVVHVVAPKGNLGVAVDSPPSGGPPYVIRVSEDSPMLDKIRLGDKIIAVDGKDVQHLSATDVSELLSKKKWKRKRKITLLRQQAQGDQGASDVNASAHAINNPAVGNNGVQQPPQGNFGAQQPQANYSAQQSPQGNFGVQQPQANGYGPQQPPQSNFGVQQPQANYGAQQPPQSNFGVQQSQANYGAQQTPQSNFGVHQPQANFGTQQPQANPQANFGTRQPQANYGTQQPQANYGPQEMSRSFHGEPSSFGNDPQQQMSRSFHGEPSKFGYDPHEQMSRSLHGEQSKFRYDDPQQQMSRSFHGEPSKFRYDDPQQQMSRSFHEEASKFGYDDPQQQRSRSDYEEASKRYHPQRQMSRSFHGEPSDFRRGRMYENNRMADNYDMRHHPDDYDAQQLDHGSRDSYLPHSLSGRGDRSWHKYAASRHYSEGNISSNDSYGSERPTEDFSPLGRSRRHSLDQYTNLRDGFEGGRQGDRRGIPSKYAASRHDSEGNISSNDSYGSERPPEDFSPLGRSRTHSLAESTTSRDRLEGGRQGDQRGIPTKYAANTRYNEGNIPSNDSYGSKHPPENFSPLDARSRMHSLDKSATLRDEPEEEISPEGEISPEREILREHEAGARNDTLFQDADRKNDTTVTIIAPAGKLGVTIENSSAGPAFVSEIFNDSVLQGDIELFDRIIELDELDVTEFKAYHISKLLALKSQNVERKIVVLREAAGTSQSRFVV